MAVSTRGAELVDRIRQRGPEPSHPVESTWMHTRIGTWAAWLSLAMVVIYAPAIGHGFIKDDFAWIADSRVRTGSDLVSVVSHARGFYRPVVSLSFTVNEWLFGLNPLGYAVTNLALVFGIMAVLWRLGRTLGLSSGAALLATTFWALNFHAIRMSVLWISGRTALLLTLFSLLAARAVLTNRIRTAAAWTLLALLSKEEAVVLPMMLLTWIAWSHRDGIRIPGRSDFRTAIARGWPVLVPAAVYGLLRIQTDAMTPATATEVYRFSFAPALLAKNALEYFDRAATLPLASAFVLSLLAWRLPRVEPHHQRWILMGIVWTIGGYALTMFLPIRSSLYVCLPAAGAALAGAAYLQGVWNTAAARVRKRLLVVGVAAALVAVPALSSRNASWVRPAVLSTNVLGHLVRIADSLPAEGGVLIYDDPSAATRLDESFGTLIQTAAELYVGRPFLVWTDPPPRDAVFDGRTIPDETRIVRRLSIRDGLVVEGASPPADR